MISIYCKNVLFSFILDEMKQLVHTICSQSDKWGHNDSPRRVFEPSPKGQTGRNRVLFSTEFW